MVMEVPPAPLVLLALLDLPDRLEVKPNPRIQTTDDHARTLQTSMECPDTIMKMDGLRLMSINTLGNYLVDKIHGSGKEETFRMRLIENPRSISNYRACLQARIEENGKHSSLNVLFISKLNQRPKLKVQQRLPLPHPYLKTLP